MKQLLLRLSGVPGQLPYQPLRFKWICAWVAVAALSFNVAYWRPQCAFLMFLFLFALLQLSRVRTSRQVIYIGWVMGLLIYGPQLTFFWRIFGPGAISLWLVLAFWICLFLIIFRKCQLAFGRLTAALLAPILWLGFEFFRSELYYLRFTWITPGFAFSGTPGLVGVAGVYGLSFLLMLAASAVDLCAPRRLYLVLFPALVILGVSANLSALSTNLDRRSIASVKVAGVQMEFPPDSAVVIALDSLRTKNPDTDLFVISEYTFDGPIPENVRAWCRKHEKYLIAGGKDIVDPSNFYNTAFVIGTNGETVFKQVKSVPIQFFKDGMPAPKLEPWNSPWGKLGICICYDLSYTRITDSLIQQGSQALIVPTMDVEEWGEYQHVLHARVAPVRTAEYGVPIFRVASSGISQLTAPNGEVVASAPFGKGEAQITGSLAIMDKGHLPVDRQLARVCVGVTAIVSAILGLAKLVRFSTGRPREKPPGAFSQTG